MGSIISIDQAGMARMQRENHLHTLLLVIGMTVILSLIGWVWAGLFGGLIAITGLGLIWATSSRMSNVVLRMYKAQPVDRHAAPALIAAMEELAGRAQLPYVPRLYWIPSQLQNAFATGQGERMVIAISDGLVRSMGRREIIAVLAHEMSHHRNGDVQVMMFADAISRVVGSFAQIGFLLLIVGAFTGLFWDGSVGVGLLKIATLFAAPTATTLLQLALSRTREYNADLGAVELTEDPEGMIRALQSLEKHTGGNWEHVFRTQRREAVPAALRTHPSTAERVARLQRMKPNAVEPDRYLAQPELPEFEEIVTAQPIRVRQPRYHLINGVRY